jgi:uncharacterized protein
LPDRTAKGVFDDPFGIDAIDERFDYGEERSNIIGMVVGRLLFVPYTLRGGRMDAPYGPALR